MKKIIVGSLISLAVLGTLSTVPVSAEVTEKAETTSNIRLKENILDDSVFSNQGVSNVMSFKEMVNQVANDFSITVPEARERLGYSEAEAEKATKGNYTYRTMSSQFTVNSLYKPTMRFYCQTSESGLFRAIIKILEVNMIRGYQGLSKQFQGKVYVNLEHANKIFYIVNGDFYNNGTTTVSAGVSIGVGQYANVSFSVKNVSNHYQYRYVESYYSF